MMRRPPSSSCQTRGPQGGIALVLVLWVIALLSVMALAAVSTSRTEVNLVRNRLDEARMRALAEAGVSMAVLRLRSTEEQDHWYPDGLAHPWRFAGQEVQIGIYNESSRVDLNRSSEQVLRDLVTAVQMEGVDADAVVAALLDWRDTDQSTRLLGAEDGEYRSDGKPYGSKDGFFDSTAELGLVRGVPKELSRLLQPHLTVHAHTPRVLLEYASPLVSAALGAADQPTPPDIRGAMVGRQGNAATSAISGRSLGGPVYRIRVSGGGPAVETLVRVGGGGGIVNVISRRFDWREEAQPVAVGEVGVSSDEE